MIRTMTYLVSFALLDFWDAILSQDRMISDTE